MRRRTTDMARPAVTPKSETSFDEVRRAKSAMISRERLNRKRSQHRRAQHHVKCEQKANTAENCDHNELGICGRLEKRSCFAGQIPQRRACARISHLNLPATVLYPTFTILRPRMKEVTAITQIRFHERMNTGAAAFKKKARPAFCQPGQSGEEKPRGLRSKPFWRDRSASAVT
jgi:hypothetical protein